MVDSPVYKRWTVTTGWLTASGEESLVHDDSWQISCEYWHGMVGQQWLMMADGIIGSYWSTGYCWRWAPPQHKGEPPWKTASPKSFGTAGIDRSAMLFDSAMALNPSDEPVRTIIEQSCPDNQPVETKNDSSKQDQKSTTTRQNLNFWRLGQHVTWFKLVV